MLRLLIDQDFDHDILRGLQQRVAELDAVTAHQVGLSATLDPELLEWAAKNKRILLTHDRKTMSDHAAERIAAGEKLAGVIIVPRKMPVGQAIDELEIIVVCSLEDEWNDAVRFLPL
jgi:predicted nuclease of predicted toxin-antitoxin system